MASVIIFGKAGCPYTQAARDEYSRRDLPVEYHDVKADPQALAQMLKATGGGRQVPVILENGRVTIGFGGT